MSVELRFRTVHDSGHPSPHARCGSLIVVNIFDPHFPDLRLLAPGIAVLTAMITPAVLILASGTLLASTSSRLGRVVDRVRMLSESFEHFAKERCILPAEAFPYYQGQGHAAQTPWWRHGERESRVEPRLVEAVLEEVRTHGPLAARDLTDHGRVDPLDWSGWKGTAKATTMELEILWTRCDVVVAGRNESGAKVYDVPERALS